MSPLNRSLLCTVCCGLILGLPCGVTAQDHSASTAVAGVPPGEVSPVGAQQAVAVSGNAAGSQEFPDSPSTEWARLQDATVPQDSATQANSSAAANAQDKPQRPVGTAAAEAPKVTGITAAEPAGVAIAPAKQRRVRTIVLKVGAIIGAGVAVGTIVALTAGTSSKPPGAH